MASHEKVHVSARNMRRHGFMYKDIPRITTIGHRYRDELNATMRFRIFIDNSLRIVRASIGYDEDAERSTGFRCVYAVETSHYILRLIVREDHHRPDGVYGARRVRARDAIHKTSIERLSFSPSS